MTTIIMDTTSTLELEKALECLSAIGTFLLNEKNDILGESIKAITFDDIPSAYQALSAISKIVADNYKTLPPFATLILREAVTCTLLYIRLRDKELYEESLLVAES